MSPEYIGLRDTMRKYHLGGFGVTVKFEDGFLYKNEPLEAAMLTNQLQSDSEFPLIFAADFERGLGSSPQRGHQLSSRHGVWRDRRPGAMRASRHASPRRRRVPSACNGTGFPTPM